MAARGLVQLASVLLLTISWSSSAAYSDAENLLIRENTAPYRAIQDFLFNRSIFQLGDVYNDVEYVEGQDLLSKPKKCRTRRDCKYAACKKNRMCKKKEKNPNDAICFSKKCKSSAKRILQSMDKALNPCDDFYEYACGGYIKRHPVVDVRKSISQHNEIVRGLAIQYKSILEAKSGSSSPQSLVDARIAYAECRKVNNASRCTLKATRDDDSMWALALAYSKSNELSLEAKKYIGDLMDDLTRAFAKDLGAKTWLDPKTRSAARDKINKIKFYIGHAPDLYNYNTRPEHIARDELPTQINAEYKYKNVITAYRALLNLPYFDQGLDLLNYAGIGGALAHEITHALDTEGIHHGKNGKVYDWWSGAAKWNFEKRTECLKDQYSKEFIVDENGQKIHLDGSRSLDENIADNGSIRHAFNAFKSQGNKKKQMLVKFEKFTEEQLFFLAFANPLCQSEGIEFTKKLIGKEYSPAKFRVNIPLSNFDEFAKAWKCPVGSNMNPKRKCVLW